MFSMFRIDVTPRGQGRARATVRGKHAAMYKAKLDVEFEQTLAALVAPYRPRNESGGPMREMVRPIEVNILAVMPRTAAQNKVSKRTGLPLGPTDRELHTKKPDADNIAKALLDAMKEWWGDDAQVAILRCSKVTAAFNEAPHYEVSVATLEYCDELFLRDLPF